MKKMILFVAAAALAILATGCESKQAKNAKSFLPILEQGTGENYKLVKSDTMTKGYSVFRNEKTGEYIAFNLAKFDKATTTNLDQYLANAIEGVDIVRNLEQRSTWVQSGYWDPVYNTYYYERYDYGCKCYVTYTELVYVGQVWVDTSRWVTTYHGGGFVFDNKTDAIKDLESLAGMQEAVAQKFVSTKLVSQYSLSATRADELAKLVTRYSKLENQRELTAQEKDLFAKDAFGVNLTQIEKALKEKSEGRETAYKDMLKVAAEVNKTSAEQMGQFFKDYVLE